jgi:Raf kinase inhibitor-like YbhB/YbcL family protein
MKLESPSFSNNAKIPQKYACDGENINPPLLFSDVPAGTKSLALIMEDPDVPKYLKPDGMFDHWIVWNMPPLTSGIEENSTPAGNVGQNGRGTMQYTGPCPPDREHRYFFYLYALDAALQIPKTSNKIDLLKAIEGHVIEKAELMGRYERKN